MLSMISLSQLNHFVIRRMIDPMLLADLVIFENRYIAMRNQKFLCSATFVSILHLYRKKKTKTFATIFR